MKGVVCGCEVNVVRVQVLVLLIKIPSCFYGSLAYARVYIIIRCSSCLLGFSLSKHVLRHLLRINELSKRMQIFSKKVFHMFGGYIVKQ